jgi:hypothetical protein
MHTNGWEVAVEDSYVEREVKVKISRNIFNSIYFIHGSLYMIWDKTSQMA